MRNTGLFENAISTFLTIKRYSNVSDNQLMRSERRVTKQMLGNLHAVYRLHHYSICYHSTTRNKKGMLSGEAAHTDLLPGRGTGQGTVQEMSVVTDLLPGQGSVQEGP